ncbi:HAMP domain-containing protein, partial [Paenibacillus ihuae]|uniref:HAMP domain-containing protein n=1 Tax=Paenibacillus ihuae TaxID=1232431 RepID=UPI001FD781F4
MIARLSGLFRRHSAPRSLRKQLLATSLLILSALLLLIGVLQYVLMRNFIYSNRAESMEAQLHSVPRDFFYSLYSRNAGINAENISNAGQQNNSPDADTSTSGSTYSSGADGNSSGQNGLTGSQGSLVPGENGGGNIGGLPGGNPGNLRSGENGRPLLLDAHTTIAVYSSDGTFKDLQQDTLSESVAPRLSNEKYDELLSHTTVKATGKYKLITAADGSQHLAVFMDLGRPGSNRILLQMSVGTGPLKDVILQQLLIFGALSVVALLAGLFLYLPALRKTLVPLSNMGEAAQSIDAGNLDVRFPVDQGQMEIDKLSQSFNGMLERLEISFHNEREAKEQMRRFAADASHELRTPLTSIHGFLEVLLRGAADNKEQLYNALKSMH